MAEQIFKKECDYSSNRNDFIGESEITVTITLGEYRKLVTEKATKDSDIAKAEANKYERESENSNLKKENNNLRNENAELKTEIYELKKKLESITKDSDKSISLECAEENEYD